MRSIAGFSAKQTKCGCVDPTPDTPQGLGFEGRANFALLAVVVGLVLLSGVWKSEVVWNIAGTGVGLPGLVRDVGLVLVTLASLALTPRAVHEANQFNWGPMLEVAKLFAGIFITIIPVIAMLKGWVEGAVWRHRARRDAPR